MFLSSMVAAHGAIKTAPILFVLAVAGLEHSTQYVQRVDLVELNHCHDEQGRHCYDQVIFYEWSPDYNRYHVVAWCLVEKGLAKVPVLDRAKGRYVVQWYDRDSAKLRQIWSPLFRETWSNSDPERANNALMEKKYREALLRPTSRRGLH